MARPQSTAPSLDASRRARRCADAHRGIREFADGGWTSLSADPADGGQGLPFIAQLWLDEMVSAVDLSFGLFPGLTRRAAEAIAAHASDELRTAYLPRMVSGERIGAMALTESGAGTDLTLLTRAGGGARHRVERRWRC